MTRAPAAGEGFEAFPILPRRTTAGVQHHEGYALQVVPLLEGGKPAPVVDERCMQWQSRTHPGAARIVVDGMLSQAHPAERIDVQRAACGALQTLRAGAVAE